MEIDYWLLEIFQIMPSNAPIKKSKLPKKIKQNLPQKYSRNLPKQAAQNLPQKITSKLPKKVSSPKNLIEILAGINDKKAIKAFLSDLLTPQELEDIIMRWEIVKQLNQGRPQRDIARDLAVSISKISRGSRALQSKEGGFRRVLNDL